MRFLIFIFIITLLSLFNKGVGQDTAEIIRLKPIDILELQYITSAEQEENAEKEKPDSLYLTEFCIKKRAEYDSLRKLNYKRILEFKKEVQALSSKSSIYYYYVGYKCTKDFDFGDCGTLPAVNDDTGYAYCTDIELWIVKQKKSEIVFSFDVINSWERSTDAVFFYEDNKWY